MSTAGSFSSSSEHAYCQSEYFRVKCSQSEVIVVTYARYGRMHISRCVRENFGYVGCSADVRDTLDLHCSGRRACSVRVLDDNFDNVRPCHDDLKSYLEVEYDCVKGSFKKHTCGKYCDRFLTIDCFGSVNINIVYFGLQQ